VTVTIRNESEAHLRITSITVPESPGGQILFNQTRVVSNEMINGMNQGTVETAGFSSIVVGATSTTLTEGSSEAGEEAQEVQQLNPGTEGPVQLRFRGDETVDLSVGASAGMVESELNKLVTISEVGGVTVTGGEGSPWVVTFVSNGDQDLIEVVAPDSLVEIRSTFAGSDNPDLPAADIQVVGESILGETGKVIDVRGIENLPGLVRIQSAGDVLVQAPIVAATQDISSGRSFVLIIPDVNEDGVPDPIYHVGQAPIDQFAAVRSITESASGINDPVHPRTVPPGDAYLTPTLVSQALMSSGAGIFASSRVAISAPILNINGKIQSGEPNRHVVINVAQSVINGFERAYSLGQGPLFDLSSGVTGNISVKYNAELDRFEVSRVRMEGGRMMCSAGS
jgi:hypothetical protein